MLRGRLLRMSTASKKRVIILCVGNSCRSQMAEALWREIAGDAWEVFSAGSEPATSVHPLTVAALAERGIDISAAQPKSVAMFAGLPFDLVVTVCGDGACPVLTNVRAREHWPFDDPPATTGDESAKMAVFRRVRDEIEQRIRRYVASPPRLN